jgi:hypothetical protein
MDLSLAGVAETLAGEFRQLRSSTVVAVVTECSHTLPRADPYFVEQAARARLQLLSRAQARRTRPVADPSGIACQRADLALEGELTARLMVACNDADGPLAQADVDRILGLHGVARMQPPVVPYGV